MERSAEYEEVELRRGLEAAPAENSVGDNEQEEDEELDAHLEREFLQRGLQPQQQQEEEASKACVSELENQEEVEFVSPLVGAQSGRLTFSFPGWDIDIRKKNEEHHPSVIVNNQSNKNRNGDLSPEPSGRSPKRSRPNPNSETTPNSVRGKAIEEDLGDRSPILEIPGEILLQVFGRLNVQDLCSSVHTCKRWHSTGLQDHLWEPFLRGVDRLKLLGDPSSSSPESDSLPRWVCFKNVSLSEMVRPRFGVFREGHDYLRRALNVWWNNGREGCRSSSKGTYSLIKKLTMNDWSLLYEALGVAFTDRTDRIANELLRKLQSGTAVSTHQEPIPAEKVQSHVDMRSFAMVCAKPRSNFILNGSSSSGAEFEVYWKLGSIKEVISEENGVVGKELWELLLVEWQRYKGWLHLISTHCPDLNRAVNFERARSPNHPATPTMYNKGLICFRSQVVLRYGFRNVLQAGFEYLTTQDAKGCTSDRDMDLLRDSHHMLQELDVADDFTLCPKNHTQTKLRQCFRSALSTYSKLALHMNDRFKLYTDGFQARIPFRYNGF